MSGDSSFLNGPKMPSDVTKNDPAEIKLIDDVDRSTATSSIGPMLPSHMLLNKSFTSEEIDNSRPSSDKTDSVAKKSVSLEVDLYGPALPPHLKKPSMTTGFPQHSDDLHSKSDNSEDEDVIGPLPKGSCQQISVSQQKLEIRASYLKKKMAEEATTDRKETKRETWMLELPPDKAQNLGLGPRSFRKREGPDMSDRSDWTDTPADRARKLLGQDNASNVNIKEEMDSAAIQERDKVMEHMAEKCKDKKRKMSLLEMHQKKLKKKKKEKKNEKPERRPFDRNIDLQANRFDEAQKKSIFKKAQLLDTRFSQGQSKYL